MFDLFSVGSLNTYLSAMDMQQKWDQRQIMGNYTADGTKTQSAFLEKQKRDSFSYSNNNFLNTYDDTDKNDLLDSVRSKFYSGGRLSPSELQMLKDRDMALYRRAVSAESERLVYQSSLRCCRTKDDVYRNKMCYIASAAERYKKAISDTGASDEEKAAAIADIGHSLSEINKAESDFVRSGEFSRLPSMSEVVKANRDLKRAQKEEARAAAEKKKEKQSEAEERVRKRKQKKAESEQRLEEQREKKAEKAHKAKAKRIKKKSAASRTKNKRFRATKAKYTTAQANNTYEARKIRRANAKAAYERSRLEAEVTKSAVSSGSSDTLDASA